MANPIKGMGPAGVLLVAAPAAAAGYLGMSAGQRLAELAGRPFGRQTADRFHQVGGRVGALVFGTPAAAATAAGIGVGWVGVALAKQALVFGVGAADYFRR